VKGVLLVDAEEDRVHRVEFPPSGVRPPPGGHGLLWLVAGIAAGTAAVFAARSF